MREARPDPKPAPRIIDPLAGARKLRREGHCRACGRRAGRHVTMGSGGRPSGGYEYLALSRHHLVPRSLRGDDLDQNLVPLCGDGTSGCHGILTTHPSGWEWTAMRLRLHLNDDELEYVRAKAGAEFLDRYYPLIQGA